MVLIAASESLYNLFFKYDVLYLNLNECKKYFKVGSSFCYYLIQKTESSNILTNADNITAESSRINGALVRIGTNEGNISTLNSQYGELNAFIGTKNNIIKASFGTTKYC